MARLGVEIRVTSACVRRRLGIGWASVLVALLAVALAGAPANVEAKQTLSPVRHVSVDDLEVGYRTGGTGKPLVLITGRSATMATWDPRLLKSLMRRFKVFVFDNRGVATTSAGTKPITIEQMASDTAGLMEALGIAQAHVLSWSMGGYIAQTLAVTEPEKVQRLVLSATDPGGSHHVPPGPRVRKILSGNVSAATLLGLSFPRNKAGRRAKAEYLAAIADQSGLVPASFRISNATQAAQQLATKAWNSPGGGVWDQLGRLEKQVLVANGNRDRIERPANSRRLARRLPRDTHCVFAGTGHAFLFQEVALYSKTVKRFLAGLPVRLLSLETLGLRCLSR